MGKDQYSGTIKSFGDKFDSCSPDEGLAYKIAGSRNEAQDIPNLISGGSSYDNFDLDMYSYSAQSPDQAKADILKFAGRMKSDGSSDLPIQEPENENVPGDINGSGKCDIADLVVMQKWLLGIPDTEIKNWKNGDLCSDNRLDSFDLVLMRELLIS